MLQLLLLIVVAAMAMYQPWEQILLAPARSAHDDKNNSNRAQAPNDWHRLFECIGYRLGASSGESHPA